MKRFRSSAQPLAATVVLAMLVICVSMKMSHARDSHLSRAEVKKIDNICLSLVDSTLGDVAWQALNPYIIRKDALRHLEVPCNDWCNGTLALLDGYFIDYSYVSPKVRFGPWRPKSNKVNFVKLRRGEKAVVSYGHRPD